MSSLKRNYTYRHNKRIMGSYALVVNLPSGKQRITLKGITSEKQARVFQQKANQVEYNAKLFPADKDWLVEMYYTLGQFDKVPDNTAIPTIKQGFTELIEHKKTYGEITKQQTIDCYNYACNLLLEVLGNIRVNQISAMHRPKIEAYVRKQDWSKNTINIRMRNVMQFLRWCKENKYIDDVPFHIKQIKVEKRTKSWIKPHEFEYIISKMDKVSRSYAVVSYHTGLRKCELNTNPDDRHFKGLYHKLKGIKDGQYCLWVNGKQGIQADIILPESIKKEYDTMVSNRLHPTTISKKFKKACIEAGFPNYRFHDLRHSFCDNQCMKTTDAHLLSLLMRQSSLNTTQKYLNDKRLKWDKLVENQKYKA